MKIMMKLLILLTCILTSSAWAGNSIYISGKFITSVKGSKILQLSIALTVGVLIALEMDIIEYFQKIEKDLEVVEFVTPLKIKK